MKTIETLDKWAEYYAAKNASELENGYVDGWAHPEAHPFMQATKAAAEQVTA
jgi:hypothetical protein